ncbi:hypothetical protein IJT93_12290 [bacterium]|nr:hypothetical protein [bacterium]
MCIGESSDRYFRYIYYQGTNLEHVFKDLWIKGIKAAGIFCQNNNFKVCVAL